MAQGRQGKRTDPDVRDYIVDRALEGWTAAAILRAMEQDEGLVRRAPGIRTVQNIARDVMTRDGSGRWSVAGATADELRLVLPVLADLCDTGIAREVTVDEASLISKLKGYAEDMPSVTAWRLTREILSPGPSHFTALVEQLLSYTPWRDGGLRYVKAFAAGRVERFMMTDRSGVSAETFDILEERGLRKAQAAKEAISGAQ